MREREREIINYMYANIMGTDIRVKTTTCMLVNGMCIRYYCKLLENVQIDVYVHIFTSEFCKSGF